MLSSNPNYFAGGLIKLPLGAQERDKMTACRTLNGKEDMKVSLLVTSLKEKKRKPPTARHLNVIEADGSGLDSDGGERCLSRSPRSETPPGKPLLLVAHTLSHLVQQGLTFDCLLAQQLVMCAAIAIFLVIFCATAQLNVQNHLL